MSAPRRAILDEPNPHDEPDRLTPALPDAPGFDWIRSLDWREFENLVATAYRLQGFEVTLTKDGADGGIDLVLTRDGERYLVQCKHWRASQVGVSVVREMLGLVVAHNARGGIVVTSGTFSQEVVAFGQEQGVQLLNGPATMQLVTNGLVSTSLPTGPIAATARPGGEAPTCPVCGSGMKQRKARQGSHAGQDFWGCERYPSCRGLVNVAPAGVAAASAVARPAPRSLARRAGLSISRVALSLALVGVSVWVFYAVMTFWFIPTVTHSLVHPKP